MKVTTHVTQGELQPPPAGLKSLISDEERDTARKYLAPKDFDVLRQLVGRWDDVYVHKKKPSSSFGSNELRMMDAIDDYIFIAEARSDLEELTGLSRR